MKFTVIPISCLEDIKTDIEKFKQSHELNNFQKWIVNERYITSIENTKFNVKSIVIAITGYSMFNAIFKHNNKQVTDIISNPEINIQTYISNIFKNQGYNIEYVHWLPQKRLAVRSGLVEYGKNNICFDTDYGSFLEISTFISDMTPNEYTWREVQNSELCDGCSLCFSNCPTGAISQENFLINTDKCLSAINESGTYEFADWIPKTAHHRLVGCLRCQDVCPMNAKALKNITNSLIFEEYETEMLLSGLKIEELPDTLADKVKQLSIHYTWESIPRNLKAMFENPELPISY